MAPGPPAVQASGPGADLSQGGDGRFAVPAGRCAGDGALDAGRPTRQEGEIESARHEGERARDWAWYSVGVGLSVYIVAFVAWLLIDQAPRGCARVLRVGDVDRRRRVAFAAQGLRHQRSGVPDRRGHRAWCGRSSWRSCGCCRDRRAKPIRLLATVYVDVFRGIPSLLVILIVGFGLAQARVPMPATSPTCSTPIFALSLTYGAYVSEVYRGGHRVGALEPDGSGAVARAVATARRCATWWCPRPYGG